MPATRLLDTAEVRERQEVALATETTLGQLLLATSRFEDAEPILRSQLARDPASVDLRSDLAAALSGQGKTAAAVDLYIELLALPDLESARLFDLGIALFRATSTSLGRHSAASPSYDRARATCGSTTRTRSSARATGRR